MASGNKTSDHLAWLTVISFLVIAGLVLVLIGLALGGALGNIRDNAEVWAAVSGLLGSLVGYFSANANQVVSFYFGSSAGSAAKTDQLAEHSRQALDALSHLSPPSAGSGGPQGGPGGGGGGPTLSTQTKPDGTVTTTLATAEPESGELVHGAVGAPPAAVPAAPPATRPAPAREPEPVGSAGWDRCLGFLLHAEGGFVDNPADKGGPTNFGITIGTLSGVRGRRVSIQDVRDLTKDEAVQIYRHEYWDATKCGQMPPGVNLCLFDTAVLCGQGTAARMLQSAAGLTGASVDGLIGRDTMDAVRACPPADLIDRLLEARERRLGGLVAADASQGQFEKGWTRRTTELRTEALAMLDEAAVTA